MRLRFLIGLLWLAALRGGVAAAAEPVPAVEFNRDVRPILADHCFQCHGPDARQRQANLRLDTADAVSPDREGGPVIVAGHPERSELWRRISSDDVDERMPPPDKGGRLSAAEIAMLKGWIAGGAKFEKHWSLLSVRRPDLPALRQPASNPLDAFVLARLEKEHVSPAAEADQPTLLRRVTFALTGLPPTPDEVESFLNDRAPDAYERVVDRLLASPRYGERMAVPWLDAARYADTSGYQSDGERYMWRWRDWVIESLNANMPFDQFTIEQLAGDLLPRPTLAQRVATGFNRNHRGNAEGGIIPEEYAAEYVADRVETTATVWLGLTLACCRCHDHKYDPFTQRDFYSLFAFFNNVPEKGRAIKIGNSPPFIQAPTRLQDEERKRLEERLATAIVNRNAKSEASAAHFDKWMLKAQEKRFGDWYPSDQLAVHLPFDGDLEERVAPRESDANGECQFVGGRLDRSAYFDGKATVELPKAGDFGFFDKFTLSAWIRIDAGSGGTIISRMTDAPQGDGYQLAIIDGKLQLNLVKRWLDDALRVETASPLPSNDWHHVAATYDGSRVAEGVKFYVDGQHQQLSILLDELNQSFATKEPLRIGGGGGPEGRFRGAIDEVRVYKSALAARDIEVLATAQSIDEVIAIPQASWNAGQRSKLEEYYLWHHAPADLQAKEREARTAERELADFCEKLPTVMVMEEMPTPRQTNILVRGQYDKPGGQVEPAVPAELPALRPKDPRNRLGLARWLVDPANPLTSRVLVNRVWQLHFGTGIVKTAEDFGRQGEWPSHLELLDWLAAELMHSRWDVKRLHRQIVTSATYRQSSAVPSLADPENRLLARGPRLRLSAEMVRDQALLASGLLVEQLGGPSVRPWQPEGLWSELTGGDDYQAGSGAEQYRRSLYAFWKRTIPPPTLATFDSPSREACVVRESRTNTPLQALALLNEPTFVAASKTLAERVIREAKSPEERIAQAMLRVVGRWPTPDERMVLLSSLERYRRRGGAAGDFAAYALVCSTILNLDETVTSQ
jgi:mono/diheme cytochrome c family protein